MSYLYKFAAIFFVFILLASKFPIYGDIEHAYALADYFYKNLSFQGIHSELSPHAIKFPLGHFFIALLAKCFNEFFNKYLDLFSAQFSFSVLASLFAASFYCVLIRTGKILQSNYCTHISLIILATTPIMIYCRVLYTELLQALFLLSAVVSLIQAEHNQEKREIYSIFFGISVSALLILKLTYALLLIAALYLMYKKLIFIRPILFTVIPTIVLLLFYNYFRYKNFLQFGYAHEAGFGFQTFIIGMKGYFIGTGKNIFLYAPVLFFSIFLFPMFKRKYPNVSVTVLAFVLMHTVLFGSWWAWHGDWGWGPRFLIPLYPLLLLPLFMVDKIGFRLISFALLGFFINVTSLVIHPGVYLSEIGKLFSLQSLDMNKFLYFDIQFSHVVNNFWILFSKILGAEWALKNVPWKETLTPSNLDSTFLSHPLDVYSLLYLFIAIGIIGMLLFYEATVRKKNQNISAFKK